MKILSLSLDKSILDKNSSLAKRTVEYGNLVEKYTVIVSSKENREINLSEKVKVFGIGAANKILTLLKIFGLAKKLIKQEKLVLENHYGFNLITVQDQYYFALIGWLLAKKCKIGLEIQIHGFEKYSGLRKLIAKFVIPKANAVRAVSQRLKKRLVDEFGVEEDRITVVPVYTRITNYELRIKNQKKDDKFIFLTVGRLVPVKNIEMQIRAMSKIENRRQTTDDRKMRIKLWIVGGGPERNRLEKISKKLGIEKNIKFLGWQSDVNEFYRKADAFLLTSHSEGWPLVIVEAASFSLPIIMTDMGSAGELIKDKENGLVIPLNDQWKLEESMIKLVEDEKLRKKLGQNARQAVLSLPSKQEILNLYKKSWQKAMVK